jgi:hypothetical protein
VVFVFLVRRFRSTTFRTRLLRRTLFLPLRPLLLPLLLSLLLPLLLPDLRGWTSLRLRLCRLLLLHSSRLLLYCRLLLLRHRSCAIALGPDTISLTTAALANRRIRSPISFRIAIVSRIGPDLTRWLRTWPHFPFLLPRGLTLTALLWSNLLDSRRTRRAASESVPIVSIVPIRIRNALPMPRIMGPVDASIPHKTSWWMVVVPCIEIVIDDHRAIAPARVPAVVVPSTP